MLRRLLVVFGWDRVVSGDCGVAGDESEMVSWLSGLGCGIAGCESGFVDGSSSLESVSDGWLSSRSLCHNCRR